MLKLIIMGHRVQEYMPERSKLVEADPEYAVFSACAFESVREYRKFN